MINDVKLPRHIAIIPDGNRRWAKQNDKSQFEGHRAGVKAIQRTIQAALRAHIEVLTIWIFSTENLKRPQNEVDYLMYLSEVGLRGASKLLSQNNIRLRFIGNYSHLSHRLIARIQKLEQKTQQNTGLILVIAANYGGRWDILQGVRKIVDRVLSKKLKLSDIDESVFEQYLSTKGLPNPDLVIRTSGEQRLSNFYLWQLIYSEFYFSEVFWPDFDEQEFQKALSFFATRERRFGLRK